MRRIKLKTNQTSLDSNTDESIETDLGIDLNLSLDLDVDLDIDPDAMLKELQDICSVLDLSLDD